MPSANTTLETFAPQTSDIKTFLAEQTKWCFVGHEPSLIRGAETQRMWSGHVHSNERYNQTDGRTIGRTNGVAD